MWKWRSNLGNVMQLYRIYARSNLTNLRPPERLCVSALSNQINLYPLCLIKTSRLFLHEHWPVMLGRLQAEAIIVSPLSLLSIFQTPWAGLPMKLLDMTAQLRKNSSCWSDYQLISNVHPLMHQLEQHWRHYLRDYWKARILVRSMKEAGHGVLVVRHQL